MKLLKALISGIFCFLFPLLLFSQDFSNKGKEFWISYSYHVGMASGFGGFPTMTLYITSDLTTNYTVEIYGGATIQTGTVLAGQVVSAIIPIAYFINDEGLFNGRTVRVLTDKNSVVYSYITRSAVSGATVCLPTQVLGKEYYSVNFTQISNEPFSNSYFTIIAVENNTVVEITPATNTKGGRPANVPFTVNLNKGQIYQVLGTVVGNIGSDLTGSFIRSIASGSGGCKRIAVFSGSGKVSIACPAPSSSDNLYQQLYPTVSWGMNYLTVPSYNRPNNYYRIIKKSATTNVFVNGLLIPAASFVNGRYYEFSNNTPNQITANEPISVAQYFTTQNCSGNSAPYDPDMIILNPVEQNINNVTLVSSNLVAALPQHHIHVIMKNGGTGISSFKLDGSSIPSSSWITHPADASYSYLYLSNVNQGFHTLTSDSGFNALAYGYANAESYGYSAGANVKDLFQFVSIQNQYATVNFPATCRGTPFLASIVFPYQPIEIKWVFGASLNAMGINDTTITTPAHDSTWMVSGRQLYRYSLPSIYSISAIGTYPIKIIANNPTPDGCSGVQEIDYDLQVFDPPVSGFNFTTDGCVTAPVSFSDITNAGGRPIIKWSWNFGDASTSILQNPQHTYTSQGTYNSSLVVITDVGCISDTTKKIVTLTDLPIAKFGISTPYCKGKSITFSDTSTALGGATLAKWFWDFGDGSPVITALTNANQNHTYNTAGTFNATLKVETSTGCQSLVFVKPIIVRENPLASFALSGNICLPSGTANFVNNTTISDGTQGLLTYLWNFGNGNSSTVANPVHNYTVGGPYTVTLTATSNNGCVDDTVRSVTNIFTQPKAKFIVDSTESCFGGTFNFTDQSTATNSTVNQWFWDFGDGTTSNQQHPNKQYAATGNYSVALYINSAAGCLSDTMTMNVQVLQLPTVGHSVSSPVCETQQVQFTSTSIPNAGTITQYNWTVNGNATGGNNSTINYTAAVAGNYNVLLTVLTDKGCSNQLSKSVTVNPKPVASFNKPNICLPSGLANFSSNSTISSGSISSYLWNFGNGQTGNTQNPSSTYSGLGPYNVSLTVTSNNGCVDDSTIVLNTFYAQPLADFTAPVEVCLGNNAGFSDLSTAPNSTITQWQWNFGDGTNSTSQNPTKNYAASGTYTVTLNSTSAIGCPSTTVTKTVIVNPLPTANFNTSSPACENRDLTFTDISVANAGNLVKWTWDYGDGTNAVLNSQAPFIHRYATAGTYNVKLQLETNKGCTSTVLTKPVIIHDLPKAGFISPEICLIDPFAPFMDTSSIAVGTINSWQWNFGDPNANAANPNTSTLQNPSHRYSLTGSYTGTLIVTSNQGCTDTVAQVFTVNGSIPLANFTVQNANTLCSNNDVVITNTSTVDFGNIVRVVVYWDYLNDPTNQTIDLTPGSGKNYSYKYPEFGTPASRTYSIRMVSYSGVNCLNETTRTITVLATPQVRFNTLSEVCSNTNPFQITQAGITNTLPGTGIFTGTGVTPTGLFNPTAAGAGIHSIRFTYTGTNSCVNLTDQTILVNPTPIAFAGPDKTVLQGGQVGLTPAQNANFPVTYTWSPPDGLSSTTIPDPLASPQDDVTYTLTVTSEKGCSTSDDVFVNVLKEPQVPNIFSPNGDGVHDTWQIPFLETYPYATVEVFNRYGQTVFYSVGYKVPWDGTIKGKPVPQGTYYYIVDPKFGRKKQAGYVDVIR